MGACGVPALTVLFLATALVPGAASLRVLEGGASSGKGLSRALQHPPLPQVDLRRPTARRNPGSRQLWGSRLRARRNRKQCRRQRQLRIRSSCRKEKDARKESPSPPPEGSGPNAGGEAKGGTDHEDTGNKGNDDATEKLKEVMEKCDASHKCSAREKFSACLQVSDNAAIGPFIVVLNKEQNEITVNIKEALSIDMDKKPLHLAKGAYGQMAIKNISPDGGEITLNDGNGDCILHASQSVSDWQQQFHQFAAYATRLNPIYGAYLFGLTVVLVGIVCLCCKFARRRGSGGAPYQQLEMSAPAPNSSGVDNTKIAADGWDDSWDDDWDDEAPPARPSVKRPASNVSANGLSLRSPTDSKDGWDVDWDD